MCVCDTADDFYAEADGYLKEFGLTETPEGTPLHASDMMDLIDGYKGKGYAVSTSEELGMFTTEVMTVTSEKVEMYKSVMYKLSILIIVSLCQ